jgi:hypothetical protein
MHKVVLKYMASVFAVVILIPGLIVPLAASSTQPSSRCRDADTCCCCERGGMEEPGNDGCGCEMAEFPDYPDLPQAINHNDDNRLPRITDLPSEPSCIIEKSEFQTILLESLVNQNSNSPPLFLINSAFLN